MQNNLVKILKTSIRTLGLRKCTSYVLSLYAKIHPNQICTRDGITYSLNLNKLVDWGIFLGGWEPETIKFLKGNISSGSVVIEVGANIGAHTLTIAKLAGASGMVYAFEPTLYALNKLNHNILLNPHLKKNITVETQIVSDHSEQILKLPIKSGWGRFSNSSSNNTEIVDKKTISIDSYVEKMGIKKVDLIKIDVDGYDFKVLSGAKKTIELFRPIIFIELCEYALQERGDSINDIFKMLLKFNYIPFFENGTKVDDVHEVHKIIGMDISINGIFKPY